MLVIVTVPAHIQKSPFQKNIALATKCYDTWGFSPFLAAFTTIATFIANQHAAARAGVVSANYQWRVAAFSFAFNKAAAIRKYGDFIASWVDSCDQPFTLEFKAPKIYEPS